MTTQLTSPWPMSMRVAPREMRRSTSARRSPSAGGARSKCSRFFPVFGISGGPPQVIFGPPLLGGQKPDPEPGVIGRQKRKAVLRVAGHLPAQDAGPEARETRWVVRIEAERGEVASH
jgi:hypothetical protein